MLITIFYLNMNHVATSTLILKYMRCLFVLFSKFFFSAAEWKSFFNLANEMNEIKNLLMRIHNRKAFWWSVIVLVWNWVKWGTKKVHNYLFRRRDFTNSFRFLSSTFLKFSISLVLCCFSFMFSLLLVFVFSLRFNFFVFNVFYCISNSTMDRIVFNWITKKCLEQRNRWE